MKLLSLFFRVLCVVLLSGGGKLCSQVNTPIPFQPASTLADSLPSDFPVLTFYNNTNPSPGEIFMANDQFSANPSSSYLMIVDNSGKVLFHRQTPGSFGSDFKPQGNGLYTYYDATAVKFYSMDSAFNVVGSYQAVNGYSTDAHELRFLPNGGYCLIATTTATVNMMDTVGYGDPIASVQYPIIQEFDAAGNLVFEWKTKDHFHIADATYENLGFASIDFAHCNSIDYDSDSTFILSFRNMDEITKINRRTGNIVWRLGGKNNQFRMINDSVGFSHQHSVRRLPNGNIIMFDNGNFRPGPVSYSRAVEYAIDESRKTATKVWEYRHSPDVFSSAMGNAQRLENGNTIIGWGACDHPVALTEVRPDGTVVQELGLPANNFSYRAFKYRQDQINYFLQSGVAEPEQPQLSLDQNFPNPANGSTTLPFSVSTRAQIKLTVYDALGRTVASLFDGAVEAGTYEAKLDTRTLAAGAYIYKLSTPNGSISRTMFVVK
jgi:hypothetical protein